MSSSREDMQKPGQRRVSAQDRDALAALVEEHQVVVYNLCYRMLGDAYLAEDAAQETFLRAFRSRGSFDPARSVRTWLLSIDARPSLHRLAAPARSPGVAPAGRPAAGRAWTGSRGGTAAKRNRRRTSAPAGAAQAGREGGDRAGLLARPFHRKDRRSD